MKSQVNKDLKKKFEKEFNNAKKLREAELSQRAFWTQNNGRIEVTVCFN